MAWQDFNNNVLNDLTDGTFLSNVEVSLFTASGSLISTVKTDPSGHYQFSDILKWKLLSQSDQFVRVTK